ncbi:MAG: amidohydrolase family protein [Armatimonadota bacterium]
MPKVPLYDANCCVGRSSRQPAWEPTSVEELLAEMDRCGVEWAAVHHTMAKEHHPNIGNLALMNELAGQNRLVPCWVVLPGHTQEMPPSVPEWRYGPEVQHHRPVSWMLGRGIRCVRMYPRLHGYSLTPAVCAEVFTELGHHRVPCFIDRDQITWPELDAICGEFSRIPVVLSNTGYRVTRDLYALLKKHRNLFMEISRYEIHDGIEGICEQFGARRLLFGTGYPQYALGCAITMLACAQISQHDKELIASGNLRRLLEEAS